MREIRFRAKTIKGGQWIEGDLFRAGTKPNDGEFAISYWDDEDGWMYENVRPDTIGEYTGLKDKNGREIFEGDIVVTIAHGCRYVEQVRWFENLLGGGYSFDFVGQGCGPACHAQSTMEVIGNIHDNPELITKPRDDISGLSSAGSAWRLRKSSYKQGSLRIWFPAFRLQR